MTDAPRYRLDDIRRFAAALAAAAGVGPERASALATHLLWYDAAGRSRSGIATLMGWLERIDDGKIDPRAEGGVVRETVASVSFDGGGGIPSLVLARAGGLAIEKARDAGVGLVRVANVASPGSLGGIVAEMAVGPVAAFIMGPGPSWALALPTAQGLPAVFDPTLQADLPEASASKEKASSRSRGTRGKTAGRSVPSPPGLLGPWALALVAEGEWLVATIGIPALEPLERFHARVDGGLAGLGDAEGRLLPEEWESRRRQAREHGIAIEPAAWERLAGRAGGLGLPVPAPIPESGSDTTVDALP